VCKTLILYLGGLAFGKKLGFNFHIGDVVN